MGVVANLVVRVSDPQAPAAIALHGARGPINELTHVAALRALIHDPVHGWGVQIHLNGPGTVAFRAGKGDPTVGAKCSGFRCCGQWFLRL